MTESKGLFDALSYKVIGCAIEVHRILGPGLLESTYGACLAHEFGLQGIEFEREVAVPVTYKGVQLDCGYRVDFWIRRQLLLELKSVEQLLGVHQAQLLTQMKLTDTSVGLLINFNVEVLKDGIRRLVLK